jgi:3-oxoacyl-[acyl-carrier protein] reductase
MVKGGNGMKLEGRTALVTGGARGLGRAYALRLAGLGADVAVADVNLDSSREFEAEAAAMTADTVMGEIEAMGRSSLGVECDVTDRQSLDAVVEQIIGAWGHLDIVVCNAGGGTGDPQQTKASSVDAEIFDIVVQRNLYGTVNTCTAVAPVMKEAGYGRIVTVSSAAGRKPNADGGYAHYGAAKAGIQMYTRYLAQELGPSGITVNCIAPGYIATGRLSVMFERIGVERLARSVPLRRLGTPEDCAKVVEFLVTDLGDYVNGAIIPIDGGSVP